MFPGNPAGGLAILAARGGFGVGDHAKRHIDAIESND
jgi:hypothetical protein